MTGLTERQISVRRGKFTASTFAGLLGFSPYGPPSFWWGLQMGMGWAKATLAMIFGVIYEDAIVQAAHHKLTNGMVAKAHHDSRYARFEKPDSVFHSEHKEWLVCHPDGVYFDAKELIQAKRHDSHLAGCYRLDGRASDNDSVPLHELIQCQIELACWRSQRGDDRFKWVVNWLAVEVGAGDGPIMCRIIWDKELAALLLAKGEAFWREHMAPGHEKRPDDSAWEREKNAGVLDKPLQQTHAGTRLKLSAEDLLQAPIPKIGG